MFLSLLAGGMNILGVQAKKGLTVQVMHSFMEVNILERVSLAGIVRVTGVSARWLQYYVNQKYQEQPRSVSLVSKKKTLDDPVR